MRFRPLVFYFLLVAILAFGKQASKEPDFANISGTNFESPFFKFHYSFPKGWSPEDDQIRVAKNRKKHEESTASLKADTSRTVNNGTTTTKVFWVYDLLVATPESLPPDGKLPLPYVRIWAMERSNMINKPGDNAKLLAGLDGREPQLIQLRCSRSLKNKRLPIINLCIPASSSEVATSKHYLKLCQESIFCFLSSTEKMNKKSTTSLKPWDR